MMGGVHTNIARLRPPREPTVFCFADKENGGNGHKVYLSENRKYCELVYHNESDLYSVMKTNTGHILKTVKEGNDAISDDTII